MRHQYVIVGLLSVICGLLGYIAAQVTSKPETPINNVQNIAQVASEAVPKKRDEEKHMKKYLELYKHKCMVIARAKAKHNAVVKTEFTFDENGKSNNVRIIESSGYPDIDADAIAFSTGIDGGIGAEKNCLIQTFSTKSEVEQPMPDYPPPFSTELNF